MTYQGERALFVKAAFFASVFDFITPRQSKKTRRIRRQKPRNTIFYWLTFPQSAEPLPKGIVSLTPFVTPFIAIALFLSVFYLYLYCMQLHPIASSLIPIKSELSGIYPRQLTRVVFYLINLQGDQPAGVSSTSTGSSSSASTLETPTLR